MHYVFKHCDVIVGYTDANDHVVNHWQRGTIVGNSSSPLDIRIISSPQSEEVDLSYSFNKRTTITPPFS